VRERRKDFLVEIFSPCPTISPVNIGIIGNTHGVNARSKPAKKNKEIFKNIDCSDNF
jgi:hypothetical protein